MSIQGISPRLPLYYDPKDGPYALIKIYKEAIAQDFKNLVLTNPGERMMDPEFGVGIKRFLFEFKDRFHFEFPAELETQVERYLPFIKILNVDFSPNSDQPTLEDWQDPHVISIKIKYHILPLSVTDTLFINNI
jgi:phage baseplate assembly protein W|tara:strand:+ start:168 stop:569 length:402 start_codon:yes stop_codon:yes gene_type:complete